MRASTCFCWDVCAGGLNSPFEMTCVGIGEQKAFSAGSTRANSRSLKYVPMGVSSPLAVLPRATVTALRALVWRPPKAPESPAAFAAPPIPSLPTSTLTSPRRSAPPTAARRVYRDPQCPARRRPRLSAPLRGALGPRRARSPPRLAPGPLPLAESRVHHSGAHPTLSLACQLRICTPAGIRAVRSGGNAARRQNEAHGARGRSACSSGVARAAVRAAAHRRRSLDRARARAHCRGG